MMDMILRASIIDVGFVSFSRTQHPKHEMFRVHGQSLHGMRVILTAANRSPMSYLWTSRIRLRYERPNDN